MPKLRSPLLSILLALALPACALPAEDDGAETAEATSALTSPWSARNTSGPATWQGPQVGSINGQTFGVFAGSCTGGGCFPDQYDRTQLRWGQFVSGAWQPNSFTAYPISNETTHDKVSLAAFNGYLYMAHVGGDDNNVNTTWISRFDPVSRTWNADRQITYPSFNGPPALAVFNNRLYFISSQSSSPYAMWYGSMDANENFSPMYAIPGHQSLSRASATVAFGKLFFAHEWGATDDLVYGTFDGTTWSPVQHIYGGMNNGALQGHEAAIAYDGTTLHLVHRRINDTFVWWTTYDGCKWSTAETQIGGQQADLAPSLSATSAGLIMTLPHYYTSAGDYYATDSMSYTKPFSTVRCGIGIGG
ncbi:MAG TPA: hypothetical protein VGC42_15065 [Kofleriaceae bacterium]